MCELQWMSAIIRGADSECRVRCRRLNAKLQTPNFKHQTKKGANFGDLLAFEVERLTLEVMPEADPSFGGFGRAQRTVESAIALEVPLGIHAAVLVTLAAVPGTIRTRHAS